MTRSEVERMPRAASRPLSLPAGGQMLRLPTSQAVAERTARSNDGAALRLGLRALAVVGFAGAAWLLCAGAAQAGDEPAGDTTTALSVVNLVPAAHRPAENAAPPASQPAAEAVPAVVPRAVRPAGAAIVAVTSAASAVVPPRTAASRSVPLRLPADRPGRVQDLAAATAAGRPAIAGPGQLARIVPTGVVPGSDAGIHALLGAVPEPAAQHSGSAITALTRVFAPVTDPLDGLLRPAHGTPRSAVVSVATSLPPALRPVPGAVPPAVGGHGTVPPVAGGQWRAPRAGAGPLVGTAAPVDVDRSVPATAPRAPLTLARYASSAGHPSTNSAARRGAGAGTTAAGLPAAGQGTSDVPTRPGPAPLRGSAGSGVSTSSTPSEDRTFAVFPASVVDSVVAFRRPPVPADVAVLRLDAKTPTVSPD